MKLKVVVKDKDTGNFWQGSNDLVEELSGVATVSTSDTGAGANLQTLQGRTRWVAPGVGGGGGGGRGGGRN